MGVNRTGLFSDGRGISPLDVEGLWEVGGTGWIQGVDDLRWMTFQSFFAGA
jgi:hypothetical protein